MPQAQQMAKQAAQQELNLGDHETRLAMGVIQRSDPAYGGDAGAALDHSGLERICDAGGALDAKRRRSWIARFAPAC